MLINKVKKISVTTSRGLTATLSGLLILLAAGASSAQKPTPTPAKPAETDTMWGDYKVIASTELGFRWKSLDGSEEKYKSDLNYKQGFRNFDGNLVLESDTSKGKGFDSLLFSNSGWGSDPSSFTRLNVEKLGIYKFDGRFRRATYYNNLVNHALGQHSQNTKINLGDFDLTLRPQDRTMRVLLGASFTEERGPGGTTARAFSDEFGVSSFTRTKSRDFRAGIEGTVLGFDYGLNFGWRKFTDKSTHSSGPSPGNNTTNNGQIFSFFREYPTKGNTAFTQFHLHRTFAERLDFTARIIYSSARTHSSMTEIITGRDNTNNFVDLDKFEISGYAKRPQTRGDLGVTYQATEKLRISNTFFFDRFQIDGNEAFEELQQRRNAAGNPLANTLVQSAAYRVTAYKRLSNLFEGDYQFNKSVAFHIGYRFSHRKVDVTAFDRTLTSPPTATNPLLVSEEEENSTNTLLAGMKIKPVKDWVIFWDLEKGQADNVFTRVENYDFTNFRARTRYSFNHFSLNASVILKNNDNPSKPTDIQPNAFGTNVKNRFFSSELEWSPDSRFRIAGGYTYHHLTSVTPIVLPVSGVFRLGVSEYYMRDSYGFIEVSARPMARLTLYGTYRMTKDKGQGDRFSTVVENIIGSYPMEFRTPEFRAAIRLTRNIDWNIGYQYYGYKDVQTPVQNYRAHLPYTSLRFYWGRDAAAR